MSTTVTPPEAPDAGPGPAGEELPLAPVEPRRPQDFGLDTRLLHRIRVIAFAILAIPLLILALLVVRFVSMPLTQAWHGAAYSDGNYPQAIERLWPVQKVNWFEHYLPHLTEGTDLLQQGKDAEAETELREALTAWQGGSDLNAPQHAQCKILNNLAISIERQAMEVDDPAARGDRLHEAETLLAPCAGGGGGGEGQGQGGGQGDGEGQGQGQGQGSGNEDEKTTDGTGERVEKERREADEKAGKDPDARDEGEQKDEGDSGDQGQDSGKGSPMDPGDPKKEDPKGTGKDEEAPTQGDSKDQKKSEELEDRNRDANSGDGEDSEDGATSDPSQPW